MTKAKPTGSKHIPEGKRALNTYINLATVERLDAIRERDGVPFGAQIDRAMALWAESKGVEIPDEPRSKGHGR